MAAALDAANHLDEPTTLAVSHQVTDRWLPVDGTEAQIARDWLATMLLDHNVHDDAIDDAVLLTTELIGNVARHTDSRSVHVNVKPSAAALIITISEQTASTYPTDRLFAGAPMPAATTASGRGLAILDSLAHQWGITRTHRTSSVWFTLVVSR